jgi:hypothetical protein
MKKYIFVLLPLMLLIGCEGKITELSKKNNTWEYSEKQDKISNKSIYIAKAHLVDDAQPTKYVEAELLCDPPHNMNLELTLFTKDDKEGNQSKIDSSKDGETTLLRLRSGENRFNKIASTDKFANQASIYMGGLDGLIGLGISMLGGSPKPLAEDLTAPELFIEIPSKNGSPVVKINFNDLVIKKVTSNCNFKPAYEK